MVSKPIAKKTTVAVRVRLRDPQRVERRVDHPDVGARPPSRRGGPLGARHPHHVAEAGEDHAVARGRSRSRRRPGPSGSRTPGSRGRGRARRSRAAGRRSRTCRSSGCARRRPPSACSGGRARRPTRISPASARPSSASRNSSTNLTPAPPPSEPGDRGAGVDQQLVADRRPARRGRSRPCSRSPVRRRRRAPGRAPRRSAARASARPRRRR